MRRRLLIVLLLGVLLAGGAALTWQARSLGAAGRARPDHGQGLIAQAGGFSAGKLEDRLALIDRAEGHTLAAQRRLASPSPRLLGAVPILGRDVRLARAVTTAGRRLPGPLPGHGRHGRRHRRAGRPGPQAGRRPVRPAGHGPLVPGLPESGRAARHRRPDRRVRGPGVEPLGPRLVKVAPYQELDALTKTGVGLPKQLAGRY